jgi:hypothetical protein
MLDTDKREFSSIMDAVLPIYRMEASKETKRIWWEVLKRHSMEDVSAAFGEHVAKNARGITPADIGNLIAAAHPDGRPGADEAWAMLPYQDEDVSVVMTEEMAEAFGIASEVDDKNGARMAFRDAYNRIVDRNRRAGIPPKWFPSLGNDKHGRETVLNEAVRLGRISQEHAMKLLPPPVNPEREGLLLSLVSSNGKLIGKEVADEDRETALKRLEDLKRMFA